MQNETKKEDLKSLGDRMKSYEDEMKIQIEKNKSFIIRLDGHSFSKFTKNFEKPHDIRIHNAMIETASVLLKTFMPSCIYTFSDEITMCFPSVDELTLEEGKEIPDLAYSGKVQKLISLSSGLASTVFYKSITNAQYDKDTESNLIKLLNNCTPHFDARIFTLPSNSEIVNNLIWRSLVDCKRNSVANLGFAHFPPKQMFGLNNTQVKEKLLEEKSIVYENEPAWYRFGTYLKKEYYTLNTVSPTEPEKQISAVRSKVSCFSFDISKLSNPLDFISLKTLPEAFKLELIEKK
ncbi:hypothetical protein RB653_002493 [Dictyostelium firmibasis]|uniref:tRNAHis guanylyltransferase catalytic domain-containing protein n=1 Tax=Dictyostelium firmibasis TaxID=79012 RepID=A0AAN7YYR4_9MYCE